MVTFLSKSSVCTDLSNLGMIVLSLIKCIFYCNESTLYGISNHFECEKNGLCENLLKCVTDSYVLFLHTHYSIIGSKAIVFHAKDMIDMFQ